MILGSFPTPVERLGEQLWIKRDDKTADVYGGNKVRKLEWLLGQAREEGKSRLITLGAAGSHQVVALSIWGKREGFSVEAVVVPQPSSEHAKQNLRVALGMGAEITVASSWAAGPALMATKLGRDAFVIPLGGSNAVGSLGYVQAAHELAAQIEAKELPEPDVVVVAMGSGGTAAGLAVGFEEVGLKTRVVGVVISPPARVLGAMARHVAKKTGELIELPRARVLRAIERIEVERAYLGKGYGHPTAASEAAIASAPFELDVTYTAKAYACALERSKNERVLYWHTLSSAPIDAFRYAELTAEQTTLFR